MLDVQHGCYFVKCREKTNSNDIEQVTIKNGRQAARSTCVVSGPANSASVRCRPDATAQEGTSDDLSKRISAHDGEMLPLPAGQHTRGRVVPGGQRRVRRGLATVCESCDDGDGSLRFHGKTIMELRDVTAFGSAEFDERVEVLCVWSMLNGGWSDDY